MSRTNWDDNHLQFCRLLAELAGAGLSDEQYSHLHELMDLERSDIDALFDRAHVEWERAKYGHHTVRKYTPRGELI